MDGQGKWEERRRHRGAGCGEEGSEEHLRKGFRGPCSKARDQQA